MGTATIEPASTTMSDAGIRAALLGNWTGSDSSGGKRRKYRIQYKADGTWFADGTQQSGEAAPENFSNSGTWRVEDGIETDSITSSSDPGEVGLVFRKPIASVDATSAVWRCSGSESVSFQRDVGPLKQEMLTLSLIAYVGMWGRAAHNARALLSLINRFLTKYKPVNSWQVVWGPAIKPSSVHISNDNVAFVVQDQRNPSRYAVVIRGTNPLSLSDIIYEVDDIGQTPWSYGTPPRGSAPAISDGVSLGLSILQELMPGSGVPGRNTTIAQFLANAAIQSTGPVEVVTTGHSLGGALSPVLALWLDDTLPQWDQSGRAVLSAVPFAGFSPGNADFATYYQSRLSVRTQRVYQSLDAVPRMYAEADMRTIPTLYAPLIAYSALFKIASDASILSMRLRNVSYSQILTSTPPLDGVLDENVTEFIAQMLWQHVQGYIYLLGLADVIDVGELFEAHV